MTLRVAALVGLSVGSLFWFASCSDETSTATGTGGGAPTCGTDSPIALAACVEQSRYVDDLELIAAPRSPGTAHHQAVQDLCADRFEEYGFAVERHDYGTGTNVIGVLPGSSMNQILLSAHYDSTPDCDGADDNATGVAGLLETARVLSQRSFERTLVVACWDEEESGYRGSDAYAQRAADAGDPIDTVVVFEMIGYRATEPNTQELPFGFGAVFPDATARVEENDNAGDFVAIIGDDQTQSVLDSFEQRAVEVDVRALSLAVDAAVKNDPAFGDLQRSDHATFWQRDIPALFVTDTSEFRYDAYHCYDDTADVVGNLDHEFTTGVLEMTTAAMADMLGFR